MNHELILFFFKQNGVSTYLRLWDFQKITDHV